jgi:hypothetical protein
MNTTATAAPGETKESHNRLTSGPAIVLYLAAAKLLLHLLTVSRYGIFRDELYYIACADHLDWGYVDQPPLIAFITWAARNLFGDSLLGLRLLPGIAGAVLVWLTGKVARDMGGGRFAQALAALAIVVAPIYLIIHHWMTMNAFEPLIWMACIWCVVSAVGNNKPIYWLWFGVLVGVGMENKYSIAFFVLGLFVGILATPERRFLANHWIWIGAFVGFLIFLPNLWWLVQHHFPFLELMHNVRRSGRDIVRGPLAFVIDQVKLLNPILFPLWAGSLLWLLLARSGHRYRMLGWAFIATLAIFILLKGKNYYLGPAYPMLFAAGAVAFERMTGDRLGWMRSVYVAMIVVAGILVAPLAAPFLPVDNYIRYQEISGTDPIRSENHAAGPLPQYFSDEFGWEEMTREVARVYNGLPSEQRTTTAIFASNYGEAGAIDFFGPKYGLPKAISNHQNYWYWGPREYTGDSVIVLGSDGTGDRRHFKSVELVGRVYNPYSRPDEHFNVFLCRGLNGSLLAIWPTLKKWN